MRVNPRRFAIPATAAVAIATAGAISPAVPAQAAPHIPAPRVEAVAPAAAPAISPAAARAARANQLRHAVVKLALSKRRTGQYVAGASGPNRYDCSGFTKWVYKTAAHKNLTHYSGAQMRQTVRVRKMKDLLPGDLLFFGPGGSQHVAMYIGRGKMIGASNPSADVRVDSVRAPWWRNIFAGAGRVITG